ncbi:hypothetical protein KDA_01020 [Dictyobacter alpinus]|uniref:Uncharacterized protein n=1 Tax=Dictyobacter alpinus TaxID=2014873 RepID=A0A402AZU7_9CHLR|nr:hypothetical protein [Dictyobacter alpinus]GCE24618.1 hypothetical protein KDA_01020 [Dictyobacter alpinus]
MQNIPMRNNSAERDYKAGFTRIMWLSEQARLHGWHLNERQLINEIVQRERAAHISEKSSLPIVGSEVRSAAWNRGQADALRTLLRSQRESYD